MNHFQIIKAKGNDMSLQIRTFVGKWKDILVLASLIISMGVFLSSSSKSSGRQEQSLIDIKGKQANQDKSICEVKADVVSNKATQDGINKDVAIALTNIANTNAKTASILGALSKDHAKLMKMHGLYPESPIDLNFRQEKLKPSEEKIQASDGRMQPFKQ